MSLEAVIGEVDVSRETRERLAHYQALLEKWQKAINLVSAKTLSEAWSRHFLDSAQLAPHIQQGQKLIDLGSGAGFPGLVLAILRPDLEVHLIESDERKCHFLRTVSRETQAEVHVHTARIEAVLPEFHADVITARAFASLDKVLRMSKSLWQEKPDLRFLLLKGQSAKDEIAAAQTAFHFDYKALQSHTDPQAKILLVENVAAKI